MPFNKTQWSSWNVQHTDNNFFLTYWMNNLQKLNTTQDIFVSLGEHSRIDEDSLIKSFEYQHPIYSEKSIEALNISEIGQKLSYVNDALKLLKNELWKPLGLPNSVRDV